MVDSERRRLEKRSLTWWIGAVVAPLGIVGGPLALASLLSGLITWEGVPGYLVNYWATSVTPAFQALYSHVAGWFGFPSVPRPFTDYFTIGVLYVYSDLRAAHMVGVFDEMLKREETRLRKAYGSSISKLTFALLAPLGFVYGTVARLPHALFWPLHMAYSLASNFYFWQLFESCKRYAVANHELNQVLEAQGKPPEKLDLPWLEVYPEWLALMERSKATVTLTFLPLALFGLLWLANSIGSMAR